MQLKKNFRKENGMLLRTNDRTGSTTFYLNATISDQQMIEALREASHLAKKKPAQLLRKYIQRAWDSGITFEDM